MKRLVVMAFALMMATGLFGAGGIAAPFQSEAPAAVPAAGIEQVQYGCRRDCHYSQAYGAWIRGTGPYCRIVQCAPAQYVPPPPTYYYPAPKVCTKDWHCVKTGPLGLGRRCYWREICG
jgi:hypothetical protein